ncbi:hypothetical protein THRCLA_20968 [Thraustotheca clavata]|uniref:Uncharacterized protein n=1 Tax=Thraustotheca clavata TaxID=74557 RepID=A0A1W0A266_9STRA|nr:hypothetical protein THRCLA_20968 [Thraustotheca clavata]
MTIDTTKQGYQKCGYRTGKCTHPSALKRNGQYHRLCAFHRQKANWNQMKLDRKKREHRRSLTEDDQALLSVEVLTPRALDEEGLIGLGSDELEFFLDAIMTTTQTNETNFY